LIKENLNFIDLGLCDYNVTLQKQKNLWQKRLDGKISDTLILVEHPLVFTIGQHGEKENLLVSESFLKEKNIQLYRVDRGGDITFHGPGQIIGYPIFLLNKPLIGIKRFVCDIEECLCNVLKSFNIKATTKNSYIGVWVENKKIASIGIAISHHVTYHGFALNVSTDLSYFNYINPCGNKDIKMTSMEKILNKKISMDSVKKYLKTEFLRTFSQKY
jgi:lipoate-protein ligase B